MTCIIGQLFLLGLRRVPVRVRAQPRLYLRQHAHDLPERLPSVDVPAPHQAGRPAPQDLPREPRRAAPAGVPHPQAGLEQVVTERAHHCHLGRQARAAQAVLQRGPARAAHGLAHQRGRQELVRVEDEDAVVAVVGARGRVGVEDEGEGPGPGGVGPGEGAEVERVARVAIRGVPLPAEVEVAGGGRSVGIGMECAIASVAQPPETFRLVFLAAVAAPCVQLPQRHSDRFGVRVGVVYHALNGVARQR